MPGQSGAIGNRCRRLARLALLLPLGALLAPGAQAQDGGGAPEAPGAPFARRVEQRIATLQAEAAALAGQVRTLLDELRQLEIERDLQATRVDGAEAAAQAAQATLDEAAARLASLEARRLAEAPDVAARLVEIYKQGRGGDARLLLGVSGVRELGRAPRTLAALTAITEQRLEEHRRTVATVRQERTALQARARELQAALADAEHAQAAAGQAVAARDARIAQIDARRDLNAALTGDLQLAAARLDQQVRDIAAGRPIEPIAVPLAPFRGALEWLVAGPVTGAFGDPSARLGGDPRTGVDIRAEEGAVVRAVHPAEVQYAGRFAGFGTLVILDHGAGALSLYGYLASASVGIGDRVDAGAPVGEVGVAPAGPPALYFEMRFDGRSVDPVEWLSAR